MDKNCTEKLMNILKDLHSVSALTEYVSSLEEMRDPDAYLDYFLSLPEVKTLGKAEVIRRSGLDRTYCYQILNGRKKAGRDKLICLCLAAGLSIRDTQRILELSKNGILYARDRRDAILIFAFQNQLSVSKTNELLAQFQESILD